MSRNGNVKCEEYCISKKCTERWYWTKLLCSELVMNEIAFEFLRSNSEDIWLHKWKYHRLWELCCLLVVCAADLECQFQKLLHYEHLHSWKVTKIVSRCQNLLATQSFISQKQSSPIIQENKVFYAIPIENIFEAIWKNLNGKIKQTSGSRAVKNPFKSHEQKAKDPNDCLMKPQKLACHWKAAA